MTPAQTRLRDLRNRQSKERGRMAELAVADTLTDETRAELDGIEAGTPDLERQIRAATVAVETEESEQRAAGAAGDTPAADAENRERAELRGKVRLASYLSAAVEKRAADGAEAEYLASLEMPALGRNGGTAFPLELLAPPEQRQAHTEDRATTNVDIMTTPRTWLDRLFAETAAMRLGVNMESVPAGSASYPVTTAGASAAQRQRSTDAAADAAWDISVVELKPKRNAVRLLFSIEDAARIPGLESALNESFGNMFRGWVREAGLSGLAAHGLRKAGARRLAEAGATEFEVMSFLGHGTAREASRYVAAANRATLADSGMAKLGAETGTKLSNLSERLDKWGS